MRPSIINFLQHIKQEITYVLHYSNGITYTEFIDHPFLSKAFIRSFKTIGEACKNIPSELKVNHPEFDWQGFAGMRDKLIHHYWGIDYELMWDAIQKEMATNKEWLDLIIEQESANS